MEPSYDAIVLAGGSARRLGGVDKPMVRVGGRTMLDRVLEACAHAGRTVVVGPARPVARPVLWTREEPPGGGPAAALHAGLRCCADSMLGVFAADLPFLDAETVRDLLSAAADRDGAAVVDRSGRWQWLTGIYRREALVAAFERSGDGRGAGLPLGRLMRGLALVPVAARAFAAADCDTWEDVASARLAAAESARGE